ncbi:MAG: uncharacterized protein JWQ98_1657 [Chlorobi bacterium]|nr:uncharacterized protein [Chlorobiota bacterium]
MPRHTAFLRAINVGGHTVKMDRLRALFEEMGFTNVATLIASGNVIFDSPARNAGTLEKTIEEHLRKSLGYDVATFIRSAAELAAIVNHQPFPVADIDAEGTSLHVMFLHHPPAGEVQEKLSALPSDVDEFHVHGREIYSLCRAGLSGSPLFSGTSVDRAIGAPTTARNITTVRKLSPR